MSTPTPELPVRPAPPVPLVRGLRAWGLQLLTAYALAAALLLLSLVGKYGTDPAVVERLPTWLPGRTNWDAGIVVALVAVLAGLLPASARLRSLMAFLRLASDEQGKGWRLRRALVVLVPALAVVVPTLVALAAGSDRAWKEVFSAAQIPLFLPDGKDVSEYADLAHLYDASRCAGDVEAGVVACDRFGRAFNQNPLWIDLAGPIFRHVDLLLIGSVLMVGFLLAAAALAAAAPRGHLVVVPLLFSPAAVLAVERGNHDLVVWAMLVAGALLLAGRDGRPPERWADPRLLGGAALLLAAAVLKVFPLVALVPFLLLPGARRRAVAGSALVLGAAYWLFERSTLEAMLDATQRGYTYSYGFEALGGPIAAHESVTVRAVGLLLFVAAAAVALLLMVLVVRSPRTSALARWSRLAFGPDGGGERARVAAVVFAAVYAGTYFAGPSWDYRLVIALLLALDAGSLTAMTARGLQIRLALALVWMAPHTSAPPVHGMLAVAALMVLLELVLAALRPASAARR